MNTKKSYLVDCHEAGAQPLAMTAGRESGRTLTEMLGVLAIMGVLTVGGIAGFNWAMDRWRANRIIDGVEERALVGSRLRLSGMNRTMEIADAVVAQTGGTIEDYATTVSNTGKHDEKTYFSVQVAGVSPQVCENVMNLNWQLPVEVYAGEDKYTGDTVICAGEGTVDLTFVFAADLITKKDVKVVDRNNPTCQPTQVWTCKTNNANGYKCCTAGMLCLADGEEPSGVSLTNKGNCPRGTHQCRNNQCVCRKSCPTGQNQDPKTCACSSQTCETGVWSEAKGECVECIQNSDCPANKQTCNTSNGTCSCKNGVRAQSCTGNAPCFSYMGCYYTSHCRYCSMWVTDKLYGPYDRDYILDITIDKLDDYLFLYIDGAKTQVSYGGLNVHKSYTIPAGKTWYVAADNDKHEFYWVVKLTLREK